MKIRKKIKGEVVAFLLIMPIWMFFLAFLGLQYNRVSSMNQGENTARNAIRSAVKEDNYDDAFQKVFDSLAEAGIDIDESLKSDYLNVYVFDSEEGIYELANSNEDPGSWATGNAIELTFETNRFFRQNINEICFAGDNCINFFRDVTIIRIRALIE